VTSWEPDAQRQQDFESTWEGAPERDADLLGVAETVEEILEINRGGRGGMFRAWLAVLLFVTPIAACVLLWYLGHIAGILAIIGAVVAAFAMMFLLLAWAYHRALHRFRRFEERFARDGAERPDAEWIVRGLACSFTEASDLCRALVLNPDAEAEPFDAEMETELRTILIPRQLADDSPALMLSMVAGVLASAVVLWQLWQREILGGGWAIGLFVGALLVVFMLMGTWLEARDRDAVRRFRRSFPHKDDRRRRARDTLEEMCTYSEAAKALARTLKQKL